MAQKKRRRRPSGGVYAARRRVLLLLFLALVILILWKVLSIGKSETDNLQSSAGQTEPSSEIAPSQSEDAPAASQAESESAPQESAESEQESQPESQPDKTETAQWNLLLVNEENPIPDGYIDSLTLEAVSDGYQVDSRIADPIRKMFNAAREDGISLVLCSAFRSADKQEENFNRQIQEYIAQGDSEEEARKKTAAYYAVPGYSEHHTGLAVDIVTPAYTALDEGYADTPAARWLLENAHIYGFVLRYPKDKESITKINFEPWHYRYVGVEQAKAIKDNGYCLEEYLYVANKDQTAAPQSQNP